MNREMFKFCALLQLKQIVFASSKISENKEMTKSKTLSLKKPLSLAQEVKIRQLMGVTREEKQRQQQKEVANPSQPPSRKNQLHEARHWLMTSYPDCFKPKSPKPLKIGILKDIFLQETWPYSKKLLRQVLAFYTGSPDYQHALLTERYRISLIGEVSDAVTNEHKANAAERLKIKKKQGAVNKNPQDEIEDSTNHLKEAKNA